MNLKRINSALLVLIILVNAYILVAPAVPGLLFSWHNRGGTKKAQLTQVIHKAPVVSNTPAQPNHLVIPSMLLDNGPIFEGSDSFDLLNKGVWHVAGTSSPDKGGNTVLAGHRFSYTGPRGIFYFLNKVKVGDEIGLWWSNKKYLYKVQTIHEVPPTDLSIEASTTTPQITLFTCTPLWHPTNRLVVTATLEDTKS